MYRNTSFASAFPRQWIAARRELEQALQPAEPKLTKRNIAYGALAVTLLPAVAVIARGRVRAYPRKQADVIVVLGTAQYNGTPSRTFAARLQWAARLWHENKRLDVITVGGNLPGDNFTEAEVGRKYLLTNRVDPEAVVAIEQGNDTRGSLEAVRAYLKEQGREDAFLVLVTGPLHALRSEFLAWQMGLKAIASATGYHTLTFGSPKWFKALAHELGGLVVVGVAWGLGEEARDMVEQGLRRIAAGLWPSRKARYNKIYNKNPNSNEGARGSAN